MNRNLLLMEMKRNALSLVLWMLVVTFLISLTMSFYQTFLENQSQVMGMMSLIPKGALQLKGFTDLNDLFSILGFYAANNVVYMLLLGSIFGAVLGSNILLKEEYNKTAEYLLTRPLNRSEIFISKLFVVLLYVLLLNIAATIVGFTSLEYFKEGAYSIRAFLILSLYTLLLNSLFATIGLFLSTLVKRARPITVFSIGLVLLLYFINSLSVITKGAAKIGYLSPFKYASMDAADPAYTLNPWNLLYFVGISLLLGVISYRIYIRKNIYT